MQNSNKSLPQDLFFIRFHLVSQFNNNVQFHSWRWTFCVRQIPKICSSKAFGQIKKLFSINLNIDLVNGSTIYRCRSKYSKNPFKQLRIQFYWDRISTLQNKEPNILNSFQCQFIFCVIWVLKLETIECFQNVRIDGVDDEEEREKWNELIANVLKNVNMTLKPSIRHNITKLCI